jgi:hypothetical protein
LRECLFCNANSNIHSESNESANNGRQFTVKITHQKTLNVKPFREWLAATENDSPGFEEKEQILTALNLMLSRSPAKSANSVLVGKSRFYTKPLSLPAPLAHGLNASFGFERSVRGSLAGFLLQINCVASAFYKLPDGIFYGDVARRARMDCLIHEWSTRLGYNKNDDKQQLKFQLDYRKELEGFIKGLRVNATYGRKLAYVVCGLAKAWGKGNEKAAPTADSVKFEKRIETDNSKPNKSLQSTKIPSKSLSGKVPAPAKSDDAPETRLTSVREHLASMNDPAAGVWYPNGLVLNVGTKDRPICIPAELLQFEPETPYRHLLNGDQTQAMVRFACKKPTETRDMIKTRGLAMFGYGEQQTDDGPGKTFDIAVERPLLNFQARLLGRPTLVYTPKNYTPNEKGSWLLKDVKFQHVAKGPVWAIVELREEFETTWANDEHCKRFRSEITRNLIRYCFTPQNPPVERIMNPRRFTISQSSTRRDLELVFAQVERINKGISLAPSQPDAPTPPPKPLVRPISLLYVILSSKSATIYETLNMVAEVKYGIHTICTVKQAVTTKKPYEVKSDPDFITNIMLKTNLKMGGTNTSLDLKPHPAIQKLLSNTTMIVGADVTHAGVGSKFGTPSIAAVVASRDASFQQYPAAFSLQGHRTEIIGDLENLVVKHLKGWAAANRGTYPTQVIFYRDGVSEGEFKIVKEKEHLCIKKAFARVYGPSNFSHPKLLLICVVKRSNARFYPHGKVTDIKKGIPGVMDGSGNPWPGLVVDTDVTSKTLYDFYLQSHKSIQGTAKPAHYVVIVDEIGATPDVLQKATYWQCYTFGRSLQAIAAHPAARLADVACTRGRAYMRDFLLGGDDESADGSTLTLEQKEQAVYDAAVKAWGAGPMANLADSMYYI